MKTILLDNSPVLHFFVIDKIAAVRGPHVALQETDKNIPPGRMRHHHTITVYLKDNTPPINIRYGRWIADREPEDLDIINDNMAQDFEILMNALRYS